jgi:excisionase family DNA binding protein
MLVGVQVLLCMLLRVPGACYRKPYRMTDEEYLSPAQVAEELQVTTVTVRRWIASGELPAAKAGPRKWRIRRADVSQMLSPSAQRFEAPVSPSEDPSFSKHLLVPGEH